MATTTQTITATRPTQDEIRKARLQAITGDYAIRTTGAAEESEEGAPGILPAASTTSTTTDFLEGAIDPTTEPHPRVEGVVSPDWWPTNWRRVPEYAPINRNLNIEARPAGGNSRQKRMITMVLNGCGLLSTYAYIWRNTAGRISDRADKIFHYEIGGEY